jgi:pimeloyl-ACP methyl ester carboxylesterase
MIAMQTSTATTRHLEVAGLRVRCLVEGAGPPVLVLHGWGASIEAVRPITTALAPIATAHAVDLPGFGESDPPPEAWGVGDYARFVDALMATLGVESAPVVGHSFGGRIAIHLAVDFPHRATKLVLVDSAGIRRKRAARYYRRVALAKVGRAAARVGRARGARLQARIREHTASRDYLEAGELRETFVKVVSEDLHPLLPRIAVPTLLVWGSEDSDTPVADGELMERLIPDAGLVVLDGAGHYSYADAAPAFGRVVRHFLGGEQAA